LPRRKGWLPVHPTPDGVRQIKSKVNPRRALPACARSRYPPSRSTGYREYVRSPAAGSNGILPPGKGEIRPFYRGNTSFSLSLSLGLSFFVSLPRLLAGRTRADRSIAISIHAPPRRQFKSLLRSQRGVTVSRDPEWLFVRVRGFALRRRPLLF